MVYEDDRHDSADAYLPKELTPAEKAAKDARDAEADRKKRAEYDKADAIRKQHELEREKASADKRASEKLEAEKVVKADRLAKINQGFDKQGQDLDTEISGIGTQIGGYQKSLADIMSRMGNEDDEAYKQTLSDRTSFGQMAAQTGRQYDQGESDLAASLQSRGLMGASGGTAQGAFGGLMGSKSAQLSGLNAEMGKARIKQANEMFTAKSDLLNKQITGSQASRTALGGLRGNINTAKLNAGKLSNEDLSTLLNQYTAEVGTGLQNANIAQTGIGQMNAQSLGQSGQEMQAGIAAANDANTKASLAQNKAAFDFDKQKYADSQEFDWGGLAAGLATTGVGAALGGPIGAGIGSSLASSLTGGGGSGSQYAPSKPAFSLGVNTAFSNPTFPKY